MTTVVRIIFLILICVALYFVYRWFGMTVFLWVLTSLIIPCIIGLMSVLLILRPWRKAEDGNDFSGKRFCFIFSIAYIVVVGFVISLFLRFGWKVGAAYLFCAGLVNVLVNPKDD